MAPMGKFKKQF